MAKFPSAIWKAFSGIGAYKSSPFKIIHHTTEGSSAAGAISTYRSTGSYPHFTVDEDVVYQHVDTETAVTALEHPAGTPETNRSHAVQIELVGFAGRPKSHTALRTMSELCRWLEQTHDIPRQWPSGPPKPPAHGRDPGGHNRSESNWLSRGGHYGHSQVPHNQHWDPAYTADEVALVMSDAPSPQTVSEATAELQSLDPMNVGAPDASDQQTPGVSDYVRALVRIAEHEHDVYHGVSEADEPLRSRINAYCTGIGISPPHDIAAFPWSATFVSWCVKQAGAQRSEFAFSTAHAVFVKAAIANIDARTGVFRARRIADYGPRIGDLIQRNRSGGSITYDEARRRSDYVSHSSIVVDVGEDRIGRFAMTIGGNESDSIRRARVALDAAGRVIQKAANPFICVVQDLKLDPTPDAAVSQAAVPAAAADRRQAMAQIIVNFEARRDHQGRLAVYMLPPDDGGGRYEVAGINERYNRALCDELVDLVQAGRQAEAERRAVEFIAEDTDIAARWTSNPAIEFYLRDSIFNRGPRGAAWILQRAVGVETDGVVGITTTGATAVAERNADALLRDLRQAREAYERLHRDETSRFWKGLVNRWNNALAAARTFLGSGRPQDVSTSEDDPGTAPPAPATTDTGPPFDFEAPPSDPEAPSDGAGPTDRGETIRFEPPPDARSETLTRGGQEEDRATRGGESSPSGAALAAPALIDASAFAVSSDLTRIHKGLEQQLFARSDTAVRAESVAPPDRTQMIVGVGIGSAHRDFESVGPLGPGAPVLNVYVAEPMSMDAVKAILVDHFAIRAVASDKQPVNVLRSGPIDALMHRDRVRPSPCGISVAHFDVTAGTQGVLATGRDDTRRKRLLMISNNHVLANENDCQLGDAILQPGKYDLAAAPANQVAVLERWVPLDFSAGAVNYVDCATGWCWPDRVRKDFIYRKGDRWDYFQVGPQMIDATPGMLVGKSGRTTEMTTGRVIDVSASIRVNYTGGKSANFRDQITVKGTTDAKPFSQGGDSGSLVWGFDQNRRPVGLLFAGGAELTFVNKLNHVLDALDVTLFV